MANEPTKENKGLNIKVLKKTHVMPKKQLGRRECELTIYDLFHLTIPYNKKLLVYKGMSSLDFEDIVDKLQDSLGVVLDDFYQLAGKMLKDEDGYYKVVYDDDHMQGVEVVAATSEESETTDLTDGKGLKELVPCNGFLGLHGLHQPLLAVQVTKLKDGFVTGFAFNHAILDGSSTWHFISSWAQICFGSKTISAQPILDRTKVQNRRIKLDLPQPSETAPQNGAVETVEMEPTKQRILKSRIFNFTESSIDRIKFKVNAIQAEGSSKHFSTFQCFAAHVWRSVTRARKVNPQVKTFLAMVADCRKRVNPPTSAYYFGNLIQGITTEAEAGLLLENPPELVAEMIQKSIEMHDSEAIDKYNTEWEKNPRIERNEKNLENFVVIGGSPRFKVYEVDFGWGKPESVWTGGDYKFDGMVHLYKGKNGGKSIDMEISLEANAMENLENDKEFLMEAADLQNDEEFQMGNRDCCKQLLCATASGSDSPASLILYNFWSGTIQQLWSRMRTKIISPIHFKNWGTFDQNHLLQGSHRIHQLEVNAMDNLEKGKEFVEKENGMQNLENDKDFLVVDDYANP